MHRVKALYQQYQYLHCAQGDRPAFGEGSVPAIPVGYSRARGNTVGAGSAREYLHKGTIISVVDFKAGKFRKMTDFLWKSTIVEKTIWVILSFYRKSLKKVPDKKAEMLPN